MTAILRLARARIEVLHRGEPQLVIPLPALAIAALLPITLAVLFRS
jgi:hypothetical protein